MRAADTQGTPPTTHLFVYGTLRRGGSNDIARIAPAASFVTFARVRGCLYDVNGRWPSLVLDDAANWVSGEIYAVPPPAWPALDALEDPVTPARPDGAYFKVTARAEITASAAGEHTGAHTGEQTSDAAQEAMDVTLYTANPATTPLTRLIASGDWLAYARLLALRT